MRRHINIAFHPDGTIEAKAVGFKGPACEKALKEIVKDLDADVLKSERTPDFYAKETVAQRERLG